VIQLRRPRDRGFTVLLQHISIATQRFNSALLHESFVDHHPDH